LIVQKMFNNRPVFDFVAEKLEMGEIRVCVRALPVVANNWVNLSIYFGCFAS
jgi:hypothetical protein